MNIGGWHWIAVSARVGCPDEASPYFVIDSMAKKSWYMKNCSDAKALKKFFTKAINEAAGKMVEDAFGETYARQGAIIAVFKTPESYACAICGGVGVGAGADAEVATGGATEASPKSKGGKRKHKRKSVRRRRRSNRRRTIKKRK